ncbi:MAG: BrnT family toxin [Candidatus Rokuibacteriota bacterium]
MTYEWDPVKAAVNAKKHRVSFEEAASVFLDPSAMTYWDPDHSEEEAREITIGRSAPRRVLFVAHAAREGRIRIISARRATRREQRQYEEQRDETTP